jgi:hypothetical protein
MLMFEKQGRKFDLNYFLGYWNPELKCGMEIETETEKPINQNP